MPIAQAYAAVPYQVQEIHFDVAQFHVAGDLLLPVDGTDHPLILFVWGSGAGGRHLVGKPSQLITTLIQAGYAVYIGDKPGSGESTGDFSADRLLHERARLLAKEVEIFSHHPAVNPQRIGVYGGSQAGYVIALALEMRVDFAFMVAVSCPVVDSVAQSAYQVEQQILCAGYPLEVAGRAREAYVQRERAQTYAEYVEAARYLDENPVVRDDLDWGGIVQAADFAPRPSIWEEFFEPRQSFSRLTMPVLAIFGEKDTQVDPHQGAEVYRCALRRGAPSISWVVMIPHADHNMRRTRTGCLREQRETYSRPGGASYHPEFLRTLDQWLDVLNHHWRTQ